MQNHFILRFLKKKFSFQECNVRYSLRGCWNLFYDSENIDRAWERISTLYQEGKLPGVINISKANFPDESGGFAIGAYCGPYTDADFCFKVGKLLVKLLNHKRQKCNIVNNWPYKKYIYFKPLKVKDQSNLRVRYK